MGRFVVKRNCRINTAARTVVLTVESSGKKVQDELVLSEMLRHLQDDTLYTLIECTYRRLESKLARRLDETIPA